MPLEYSKTPTHTRLLQFAFHMYNIMRESMRSLRIEEVAGSQWPKAKRELFENNLHKFTLLMVDHDEQVHLLYRSHFAVVCYSYFLIY
jgi:hypothetical protein